MVDVISLMIQTILILFLFEIIYLVVQLNRTARLEKRFKKYTWTAVRMAVLCHYAYKKGKFMFKMQLKRVKI